MVKLVFIAEPEEPTYDSMSELIDKVNEWAISHGLDKGNPKVEWMKVTEEVGEIRDVFLKPHDFADPEWSLKDAIGDSIVTLIVLCLQLGYDVEECLTNAVELHGKVTGKSMVGKLYTIDCGAYGKFLVSKEQYDSVQVGDDIPIYLKGRGQ